MPPRYSDTEEVARRVVASRACLQAIARRNRQRAEERRVQSEAAKAAEAKAEIPKVGAAQTAKAVEYSVKAPTIRRRAHRLHQSSHRHRDGWILGRLRTPKTAGSRVSSVSSGGQFLESDVPGADAALLPKTKMKARLGSAYSHAAEQPGEPGAASSSELNSRPRLVCLFRS